MEALLPVTVAILLSETGGRMQRTVTLLSKQFGGSWFILFAVAVASFAGLLFAAFAGVFTAEMLNREARTMLLGLALVFSAIGVVWPRKPVDGSTKGGAFYVSLWRAGLAQFGDNSQFLVFAFAARTDAPIVAALAGFAGVMVATLPAWAMPAEYERTTKPIIFKMVVAVILALAGMVSLLSAWRLV